MFAQQRENAENVPDQQLRGGAVVVFLLHTNPHKSYSPLKPFGLVPLTKLAVNTNILWTPGTHTTQKVKNMCICNWKGMLLWIFSKHPTKGKPILKQKKTLFFQTTQSKLSRQGFPCFFHNAEIGAGKHRRKVLPTPSCQSSIDESREFILG